MKSESAGQDARNHGEHGQHGRVINAAGQVERKHADKMHGPDAGAHNDGSDANPYQLTEAARCAVDPACNVERSIGGEDGDENGDNNKDRVERPDVQLILIRNG